MKWKVGPVYGPPEARFRQIFDAETGKLIGQMNGEEMAAVAVTAVNILPDMVAALEAVERALAHGKIKNVADPNYVNALTVVADHSIASDLVAIALRKLREGVLLQSEAAAALYPSGDSAPRRV